MRYLFFIWTIPMMMLTSMTSTNKVQYGLNNNVLSLNFDIRPAKDNVKNAPLLVLLHGYGSNKSDLFSIAEQVPENWIVISLNAPLIINKTQFKWYNVEMMDGKITLNFDDLQNSLERIEATIAKIVKQFKVDSSRIITAGFSQGANMSSTLALTKPNTIKAASIFSGRFIPEIESLIKNKKAKK
ncbi:MAG: alpha/beta hydrolase [Crocinitomicaceae bacterium]